MNEFRLVQNKWEWPVLQHSPCRRPEIYKFGRCVWYGRMCVCEDCGIEVPDNIRKPVALMRRLKNI